MVVEMVVSKVRFARQPHSQPGYDIDIDIDIDARAIEPAKLCSL